MRIYGNMLMNNCLKEAEKEFIKKRKNRKK